jgi:uncharacterized protein Yka (UPF0111/DUF47 family)
MGLDLHAVRQAASNAERYADDMRAKLRDAARAFENLGSAFKNESLFNREYSAFTNEVRQAERQIDKVKERAREIGKKTR